MLPTRFASESSNKDVSTGTFFRSGIIRIQGVLVIHRRVLVTSIKTNSLSCFFLFIFKSGQSCNALRGGDIIYVIGAIKTVRRLEQANGANFPIPNEPPLLPDLLEAPEDLSNYTMVNYIHHVNLSNQRC